MISLGRYPDRVAAGRALAAVVAPLLERNAIVLALPRGGVPVAHEIARIHSLPLDVFVVRKLGLPWQEELAMGAIASHGVRVLDGNLIEELGVTEADIEEAVVREQRELERQENAFRQGLPQPDLHGRQAVL